LNKKSLNTNLEALRGFAALMVVLGHVIQLSFIFNGDYEFIRRAFNYMFPTHTMVLVFFLLSGYVIGLNYGKQHYFDIKLYLRKRLVRLYPIYIISILVTILFFKYNLWVIVGHLFFLQIFLHE
jgi:peptidoglycan/LPS O-acetylase OafA/YrhL